MGFRRFFPKGFRRDFSHLYVSPSEVPTFFVKVIAVVTVVMPPRMLVGGNAAGMGGTTTLFPVVECTVKWRDVPPVVPIPGASPACTGKDFFPC